MKLNLDVELARLFGFACVVAAHANALDVFKNYKMTGFVIDEMCRSAVQLFFLVSGFFWKPEQIERPTKYLAQLFPRLAIPFVIWASVYILLDTTQWLYPNHEPRTWFNYATTPWSGGVAFHLWFLPALFVGTSIGMWSIKLLGIRRAGQVVLGLFLIGTVMGTYVRPLGLELPLSVYRNGLFFAPIFLLCGYALRISHKLPGIGAFSMIAMLGAALNVFEGLYIFGDFPHGHDLSLATLPFGVGVFGIFLNLHSKAEGLARWGRDVFGAYLIHVVIMRILIEQMDPGRSGALIVTFIAVSIVFSLALSRLAKKNRWLQMIVP